MSEEPLDSVEQGSGGKHGEEDTPSAAAATTTQEEPSARPLLNRQKAERFQFGLLSAELHEDETLRRDLIRRHSLTASLRSEEDHFWHRTQVAGKDKRKNDRYFDMAERHTAVLAEGGSMMQMTEVATLKELRRYLKNDEGEAYRQEEVKLLNRMGDTIMNVCAALLIYVVNMCSLEALVVVLNAAGAAKFFISRPEMAAKLDFSFLAFSVVFPLTFMIQSTFNRREQALSWFVDFKSALLSAALMTLTTDWPDGDGLVAGRLALPGHFGQNVLNDFRELVQLVYEYLSMPNVGRTRNVVFWSKQKATRRVHALQNDIVKQINENLYDLALHTETMRKYGFPSGEASRLHQFHQYVYQRFEHLRVFKYYRSPQSTRSFGRAYILILPWLSGPYFAWVYANTNEESYTIILACFTYLIVLGLLSVQTTLEDPFIADYRSFLPGIDNLRLDFEMTVILQALEQFFANSEVHRSWELRKKERENKKERAPSTKS